MSRIQEMAKEVTTHIDSHHDAINLLPQQARDLITRAYNVVIDVQEDNPLDVEDTNARLAYECDAINTYVRGIQDIDIEQCEEIGRIVRPITALSNALNYAEAYGE